MASHQIVQARLRAIQYVAITYPNIHKIPEGSESWTDWCYDICERFRVSTRTAHEYMRTAKARLKRKEEEAKEKLQTPVQTEKPYE